MWWEKAIWCARTPDFVTFGPPRVLHDPGLNIIDAHIVRHDGLAYLFYKPDSHDETKHIHVALSPKLEGPYQPLVTGITPVITEGPQVIRRRDLGEWWLYYDHPWEKRYGLSRSTDLRSWSLVEGGQFPEDARHASIIPLTSYGLRLKGLQVNLKIRADLQSCAAERAGENTGSALWSNKRRFPDCCGI